MKKLWLLFVCTILVLVSGCSKEKKRQENVLRYTINGEQRVITGRYSALTLYGLEYVLSPIFEVSATDKETSGKLFLGGAGSIPATGVIKSFETNDENMFRMSLVSRAANSSNDQTFSSVSDRSGGCTIRENDATHISGTFSGMLYVKGYAEPGAFLDSLLITDGYFYINK